MLRGNKFVEYACFQYGAYNAAISGEQKKLAKNKSIEQIADELEEGVGIITKIVKKLKLNKNESAIEP